MNLNPRGEGGSVLSVVILSSVFTAIDGAVLTSRIVGVLEEIPWPLPSGPPRPRPRLPTRRVMLLNSEPPPPLPSSALSSFLRRLYIRFQQLF